MREEAEATLGAATAFADVREASIAGIGGTFKGAAALYNALYEQPFGNVKMEASRLAALIERFTDEPGRTGERAARGGPPAAGGAGRRRGGAGGGLRRLQRFWRERGLYLFGDPRAVTKSPSSLIVWGLMDFFLQKWYN